jgi:hypothetical protein
MKPLPLLVAAALVLALVFSPLAFGAGSISFTSPASGTSFKGTQSYSITGAVSPIPSEPDNVFIQVKNPSGVPVDAISVLVQPTTGTFTYPTATGGTSNWVTGTYTITATDSFGATGSTTFSYTSPITPTVTGLVFQAQGSSLVIAGETAMVSALVVQNGTPVSGANFTGSMVWAPGSSTPTLLGSPTAGVAGTYEWSFPVTASTQPGLYAVYLSLTLSGARTWTQTGYTVSSLTSSPAALLSDLKGNFTALSSAISTINGNLGTIGTTVNSISTAVGGLGTTLSNIQTTLGNVNTAVQSLSGLSSQLTTATNSINATQTYVLVVAVLAAITLVLELAILVRKLS